LLLTRETLLERLRHHLQASSNVDIAVAWACDCDALSSLLAFGTSGAPLRSIVGIWGNATHPNALHKLSDCGHLRIATNAEGLFHPKFYLFHQHDRRIGWIGSANLTRPGFQQNEELVFEFADEDGRALEWFEKLWGSLPADCSTTLADYERNWRPPPPAPRTVASAEDNRRRPPRNVYELGRQLTDWPSFVTAIGEADRYWGSRLNQNEPVTGGDFGWLNTLTLGHPVVRKPDWIDLTREDHHLILGRSPYGWLGSMGAAGIANNVFREPTPENLRIRRDIRTALEPVLQANATQFADAACAFVAVVDGIPHFSGGIATRMLALARPDRGISVNNASRRRLAQLTTLSTNSLALPLGRGAHSYQDLLRWFENKLWYSSPSPQGIHEHLLADNRAALFDVFVYDYE